MLLKPVGKDYLWGGNRLKTEYFKEISLEPLAESWECSIHPDGLSFVSNGENKNRTLANVLEQHPEYLGSKAHGEFPLLVKFIDAKLDLSVQVHPDDDYARLHENQNGKTEMWYVLDALPGASLVIGFAHDVTAEKLSDSIRKGDLGKHLRNIPVHKGDVFLIPAGQVHAIGAGVLLAEIQESSNVTYRVYDYNRLDRNGNKRELHFRKALDVMNMRASPPVRQPARLIRYYPGCSREIICRCRYFETERIQVSQAFSFSVYDTSFQVILCTDGSGGLESGDRHRPVRFKKGDCVFLPAGLGRCHIVGTLELLKIRC